MHRGCAAQSSRCHLDVLRTISARSVRSANTIETLTSDIKALNAEIAEMKVQMKKAGQDREEENHECAGGIG